MDPQDDKSQVIVAVFCIAILDYLWAIATNGSPGNITNIITGLFGIAVGRAGK